MRKRFGNSNACAGAEMDRIRTPTHIPKGLDHIVFVLGLFFLSTGVKTSILQVSCFTLAHSLTLGMATFGWFRPQAR